MPNSTFTLLCIHVLLQAHSLHSLHSLFPEAARSHKVTALA